MRETPCTTPDFTNLHLIYLHRAGTAMYVDALAVCGTDTVVKARLVVPRLNITGQPYTTPAGGSHSFRLALPFPRTWADGQAHTTYLQGMRAAGDDGATLALLRAWQR